jgi:phosphopantetheine--protein transferase-like protein
LSVWVYLQVTPGILTIILILWNTGRNATQNMENISLVIRLLLRERMTGDTGIGCDIEETERFCLDRENDNRFLNRIFTFSELDYCFSFQDPSPHLAARFCAKEAIVKAFCSMGEKPIDYRNIEIGNHPSGVPYVTIRPDTHNITDQKYNIQLSLSHCKTTAMAVALVSGSTSGQKTSSVFPAGEG